MKNEEIEITHSKKNMASYGFLRFVNEFMGMAFGAYGFFFYETEIGLNVWYTGLAYAIYAVYNAINDPLIGFLTDRPFRFTKKWGRRFPWVLIGGIPWLLSYILIFTPPAVDPKDGAWILFAWLIFATCLYDTFCTICTVNSYSLFPDKYRSLKERRTASGLANFVGTFGIFLGSALPPFVITFGNLQSYIIQGGFVAIVCMIALILAMPGNRDDQIRVDHFLEKYKERVARETESFFKTLKDSLKQKNFVAFIVAYMFYQSLTLSMIASIPYLTRFALKMEASAITLVMVGFLVGALGSLYFWIKIAQKTNDNRKVIIIASFTLAAFTAPLIFIEDYLLLIIAMILWGVGLGGFWAMLSPVFSDVIDESVILTKKRLEGIYNGFQAFFGRLALVIQAISFAIVHTLTGFVEGSDVQSSVAIFGIHIHLALLPLIFMLIATLIFWKWYDLTKEKVAQNKQKLAEIGL